HALRAIGELLPDIVLMDVSIPGTGGVALTDIACRRHPAVRVIGVSRHNERSIVDAMMRAGSRGYVLKQNVTAQLATAIRAVARDATYVDAALYRSAGAAPPEQTEARAPREAMTAQEEQVLRLVSYSNTHREIGERLGLSTDNVMALKLAAMRK